MTNPAQYPGAPAPAPRTGAGFSLSLADLLVGAGSLLVFFFSFAPLYSTPTFFGAAGSSVNSWSDFAPLSVWPVLAALLAIGAAVIGQWWPKDKQYVGFHRGQIEVGLTLFIWVTLLGFWFTDFGAGSAISFGWGGVIMVLAATVAAVGAILGHLGMLQNPIGMPKAGGAPAVGYQPPQGYQASPGYQPPQGYQAPGQQYAPPPGQTMPAGPYTPPGGQQQPPSDTIV
jgi:hypothetical protein